ncbi:MAG: hypothetical protein Ct9H300mP4_04430 [Gammaproteobacteria bacterium]|nr:MAG: hypothetical protein Ct9H300mP4_04430 [Gammaproteobacteria bacterium]
MAKRSDALFVCLEESGPGEKFFESLTWNQLGLQSKPIILLSLDNYYALLSEFVEHAVEEGFLPRSTLMN